MVCLATPPGARRPPPRGVSRARCAGGPRARARHRDAERGRPAYAGRQPPGARAARVAGAVLVSRRRPRVSGRPSLRARGGYGVRAAALRAVRLTGTARRGVVRRDASGAGDGGGRGAGGVVPGDAGGGDVGAGAAGRAASSYSARGGCDRHRGEPRPDRAVRRRAHRLPRPGRCGPAGAGRRTHARSDAVIRRTKIVVTLGPATATPERIAGLIDAGANVIRVNASHGTPEVRAGWIAATRRAADAAGVPVAILVDLQGPRIRVGELAQPRVLRAGEKVVFAPEDVARGDELPTTYQDLAKDARAGARVLLDDGLLSVDVTRIAEPRVEGRVVDGGTLTSHKGMNLPGLHVSAPALTDKDREDVGHAVGWGVDYVALSFVRRADDLAELRRLVPPGIKLVAKIEKAAALEDLDGILRASDAVMVARGDLGVELPFEEVPVVQKRLIREANRHGKPVITATQMLESMVHHPRPTRAEASDVANAILDGTDAVMLSAETAVGAYPLEAVRAMDRIIREMEREGTERAERRFAATGEDVSVEDAIALGTSAVARMLKTPLIVTLTKGGFTARKVAALRPPVPILAVTTEVTTYRQLALVWGVTPVRVDQVPGSDAMLAA